MYSSDELFRRSRQGYVCVYFPRCKNNTRVSAETVRHDSKYIILFLTRHSAPINDDKNDDIQTSSPCRASSVSVLLTPESIADDVTITRQLWRDHEKSDI